MRAAVYKGPRQVNVERVPDARVERPTDVLVRITTINICGSDLHMYEGRTDFETGRVLGHENLGEVVEASSAGEGRPSPGDGRIKPFYHVIEGLEQAPSALVGVLGGANRGMTMVPRLRSMA